MYTRRQMSAFERVEDRTATGGFPECVAVRAPLRVPSHFHSRRRGSIRPSLGAHAPISPLLTQRDTTPQRSYLPSSWYENVKLRLVLRAEGAWTMPGAYQPQSAAAGDDEEGRNWAFSATVAKPDSLRGTKELFHILHGGIEPVAM